MEHEKMREIADTIDREMSGGDAESRASEAVEKGLGLDGETVKGIFPVVVSFIKSFRAHRKARGGQDAGAEDRADAEWLAREFAKQGYGKDDAERETTARGIAGALADYEQAKKDLARHIDRGGARASWLKKRIEEGAEANGYANAEDYAREIREGLAEANEELAEIRFGNGEARI